MSDALNLEALRAQVKIRQPDTSKRLVQIINSLGRSRDIFEYHKCLARDAFTAFNAENDPRGIKFAERQLGHNDTSMVRKHYGRWIPGNTKSMAGQVSRMMGLRED